MTDAGNKSKRPSRGVSYDRSYTLLFLSALFVFLAMSSAVLLVRVGDDPERYAKAASSDLRVAEESHLAPAIVPERAAERIPGDTGTATAIPAAGRQGRDSGARSGPVRHRGTLVFVIDDVGNNTFQLEPFLRFRGPLTLAVLPGVPYTKKAAGMILAAGKELILHQPMEALNGLDPGPGAITTRMGDNAIRAMLRRNLASVPGAVGLNNHMGSVATADKRVAGVVLDEARRNGLYFLDSVTIGNSAIHSVASQLHIHSWERTVFLDNLPDRGSILTYIEEGTKVAEKRGYAIMIGHVWSSELAQALADLYPRLLEQGFSLSTISRIMMDKGDEDTGD